MSSWVHHRRAQTRRTLTSATRTLPPPPPPLALPQPLSAILQTLTCLTQLLSLGLHIPDLPFFPLSPNLQIRHPLLPSPHPISTLQCSCKFWCWMQADFEHQVKLERQHNTDLQQQNEQLTQAKVSSQVTVGVRAFSCTVLYCTNYSPANGATHQLIVLTLNEFICSCP